MLYTNCSVSLSFSGAAWPTNFPLLQARMLLNAVESAAAVLS